MPPKRVVGCNLCTDLTYVVDYWGSFCPVATRRQAEGVLPVTHRNSRLKLLFVLKPEASIVSVTLALPSFLSTAGFANPVGVDMPGDIAAGAPVDRGGKPLDGDMECARPARGRGPRAA